MTPRRRWRRTNRPQTPRNSLLRSDFPANRPEQRVKKIAGRFERSARVLRLIDVGAVIPPHRLYSARAPIHPKRPYGLTRPVVPPDGSFIFGRCFRSKQLRMRRSRKPPATRFLSACRNIQFYRALGATRSCCRAGLTVDECDNPVFMRALSHACGYMASRTGQRKSFPQNIHCHHPTDSSRLRLRPFSLLRADL